MSRDRTEVVIRGLRNLSPECEQAWPQPQYLRRVDGDDW